MKAKSSAHYQREYRRRLREMGLVKKEVWILPERAKELGQLEKRLRERVQDSVISKGAVDMAVEMKEWTTESLYEALCGEDLFTGGSASVELIDGVEQALHIVMYEYGDLPLFLTVSGEQIVVEAVLWSSDEVADVARFNDAVLRTHKYFPLSTISLDILNDDTDYYHMFGALSSTSIMPNVIFEIETLASNVIQATEAYGSYLKSSIEDAV